VVLLVVAEDHLDHAAGLGRTLDLEDEGHVDLGAVGAGITLAEDLDLVELGAEPELGTHRQRLGWSLQPRGPPGVM